MELYIKHKDLNIYEIMAKGPIVIEKLEDEYTEDDYKWISKNFKAINILHCALTIEFMSLSHIVIVLRRFGGLFIICMVQIKMWCSENLWHRMK